jgi:hypothetical protein
MKMNTKDTPSDIILKALAEGDREHGMDTMEIIEATGLDIPTAAAAMTRLEASKQVRTKEVKGVGLLYILAISDLDRRKMYGCQFICRHDGPERFKDGSPCIECKDGSNREDYPKVTESNPSKNVDNPLRCSHCPRIFTSFGRRVQHEECCKSNPKNKAGGEVGESTPNDAKETCDEIARRVKKFYVPPNVENMKDESDAVRNLIKTAADRDIREVIMKAVCVALDASDRPGITAISLRIGGKEISIKNVTKEDK